MPSVVCGRVGAKEKDSEGIFLFSVSPQRTKELRDAHVSGLLSLPAGGTLSVTNVAFLPRHQASDVGDFLNKSPYYHKDIPISGNVHGAFVGKLTKHGPSCYTDNISGYTNIPIKVVVRNKHRVSRVVYVLPNIPPDEGGRTWVFSPEGFDAVDTSSFSITPDVDFSACMTSKTSDLFFMVSSAYVFVTGQHDLLPDEVAPMLAYFPDEQDCAWNVLSTLKAKTKDKYWKDARLSILTGISSSPGANGIKALKGVQKTVSQLVEEKPKEEKFEALYDITNVDLMF